MTNKPICDTPSGVDMVERVARAIAGWDGYPGRMYDRLIDERQEDYRDAARAAIEAMREPTEEMVEAAIRSLDDRGFHMPTGGNQRFKAHREKMRIRWRAMISVALKDRSPACQT